MHMYIWNKEEQGHLQPMKKVGSSKEFVYFVEVELDTSLHLGEQLLSWVKDW